MNFVKFKSLVNSISVGKVLPDAIYVHESASSALPSELLDFVIAVSHALKISDESWNIIKVFRRDFKVALLNYPEFDSYAYPALAGSHSIDLFKLAYRFSDYRNSDNPPILHRKEHFITSAHPKYSEFCDITKEGEKIGLYEKPRTIGFRQSWEKVINQKGYALDDRGRLHFRSEGKESSSLHLQIASIERHKTAIDRNQLSQPLKLLAKHGYLDGNFSILDYGCGKGDDVRELEAHGLDVCGWDPAYAPDGTLQDSDIVNLGFVLNVIEDYKERVETLKRAWRYANSLLIVSVMVAGESLVSQFKGYKDGVITRRNTFQKYYSQLEIRSFLEVNLKQTAVAVGQGIFIVFRDKLEEQRFLLERQHVRRNWHQLTQREVQLQRPKITKDLIDKNIELFTDFWETCLDLGRIPANAEFELSDQIRRIAGSHNKAHHALVEHFGNDLFAEAEIRRRDDLIVYFALSLFEKRKPQSKMPDSLKRDIKFFFKSYTDAMEEAREVLFSVGNPAVIEETSMVAYREPQHGELIEGHSWIIHKDMLDKLPGILRIYVGCAVQLYGDLDEIHLIKIHFTSGKVSLMRYDDWTKDKPLLEERIKIKLKEQDIDFFIYGGAYSSPVLEHKSAYLS